MPTADLTWKVPDSVAAKVRERAAALRANEVVRRIWDRDATVWSGTDEDRWLGWLDLPEQERSAVRRLRQFAGEITAEGVADVVLLGMGGSSLAPEVMREILIDRASGYPDLHVLDSTDPGQILSVERAVDLSRALFLVASKSGTTLEVNILKQHFFQRAVARFGGGAGGRFVLTTDPGSKLEHIARQEGFRAIFPGIPAVGGRYSALSNFGLVPAALIGADLETLLDRAAAMARRCASDGDDNPGFELGVLLGELALMGRDKPTLLASPRLASFGAWLEQLVAESLGKQGKAIIPIDGEAPGALDVYGRDRVFVHLRLADEAPSEADAAADRLERAGHPVVHITWADRYALGAEFFRWEFATAVAGAVLRVNPFDQPDVEAAKIVTRRLAAEYEKTGQMPADPGELKEQDVAELLNKLGDGDYFAILAFIEMNGAHRDALDAVRNLVRDRRKVAASVGFGPRYLHSTGQAHKGGPNTGVFLVITGEDAEDVPVPGQRYSFGTIKRLQARGDYEVLAERGRRVLQVHLRNVDAGLRALHAMVERIA